jgi:rhodanese-related sulfurtransferase
MNLLQRLFQTRPPTNPPARRVTPVEAARLVAAGQALLIDVREPEEWAEGYAAPAHLLALSDLSGPRRTWAEFLACHRDTELILYCRAGGRAEGAAGVLSAEGFRVANLGGLAAWRDAGLPIRQR